MAVLDLLVRRWKASNRSRTSLLTLSTFWRGLGLVHPAYIWDVGVANWSTCGGVRTSPRSADAICVGSAESAAGDATGSRAELRRNRASRRAPGRLPSSEPRGVSTVGVSA